MRFFFGRAPGQDYKSELKKWEWSLLIINIALRLPEFYAGFCFGMQSIKIYRLKNADFSFWF